MKQWYSECVRHLMRNYIDTLDVGTPPKFKGPADKANWLACNEAMATLDPQDVKLICNLYRRGDTLADNIYRLATARRMSQGYFWRLVDDIEYKVAKNRGLI